MPLKYQYGASVRQPTVRKHGSGQRKIPVSGYKRRMREAATQIRSGQGNLSVQSKLKEAKKAASAKLFPTAKKKAAIIGRYNKLRQMGPHGKKTAATISRFSRFMKPR